MRARGEWAGWGVEMGERGRQKEGMEVRGRVMEKARVGVAGLTEGCVFQGSGVWPGRGELQAPSSPGPRRGVRLEEEDESALQPPKRSPGPA